MVEYQIMANFKIYFMKLFSCKPCSKCVMSNYNNKYFVLFSIDLPISCPKQRVNILIKEKNKLPYDLQLQQLGLELQILIYI
mgnify:CR=1 FL=1